MLNIAEYALHRHACKAFDPTRKIPDEQVEQLQTLLRYSPSSVNSQPWHFVVAASEAGKARIAEATPAPAYAYNGPKILNASHVVVFCARTRLDASHLDTLLAQETADGRLPTAEARQSVHNSRQHYVTRHQFDLKDSQFWMEKQVYLALGTLLLGAATLGIDACPIEGFDARLLDEALELRPQGLTSVVIAALGYRAAEDFNAALPKSRLPAEQVFTWL